MEYAGFRVVYPLVAPTKWDEVVFSLAPLFPGDSRKAALRHVGARSGGELGAAGRGGISRLRDVFLGWEAGERCEKA